MNETTIVVDTDVTSFILNWHSRFGPEYAKLVRGRKLAISFTTVAEMRYGAIHANWGRRRVDLLEEYLSEFAVLHSDDRLCSIRARVWTESLRKGRPMSISDAWIAATALFLCAPLVTNNPKHFRYLSELQLISAIE